jgi:hypothetical protein
MASVLNVANSSPKIIVSLLFFLAWPSRWSTAVDETTTFLLVVLLMSYVAGVIILHFANAVLAHVHLVVVAPALSSATAMSLADLGWFIILVFTLVSTWLLVIAVWLAFFVILIAGKKNSD